MNLQIKIGIEALILTITGWIVAYRVGIRLKKKEISMIIINEIRTTAEDYYKELFPNATRKGFYKSPEYEITDKIEEIIRKHKKQLNWFQKHKIRKVFIKILK